MSEKNREWKEEVKDVVEVISIDSDADKKEEPKKEEKVYPLGGVVSETSEDKKVEEKESTLIEDLKESSNITIKVNSENYEVLSDIFKDNSKVRVVADDAITAGGVMLLSEKGNLDGNISARLEQIKCLLQNKTN